MITLTSKLNIGILKLHDIDHNDMLILDNFYLELKKFIDALDDDESHKTFTYYDKRDISIIQNHILTLLIYIDGEIAGYGHLDCEGGGGKDRKVWLGICILNKFTGKGLSKVIMNSLLEHVLHCYLSVHTKNFKAINLYFKYGFKIINHCINNQDREKDYFLMKFQSC